MTISTLTNAVWPFKPRPLRDGDANSGKLGQHKSRTPRATHKLHEVYVDLGPLDLTRRH